ncbi:MAG: ribbon-helix-helix domain-containing protein [Candidatus Poribacteria bacterium]|nr:ribbon-helix-helix domain-containing protein [Candidatus Poribacteria bacterium]
MVRTHVYLTESQKAQLQEMSTTSGVPISKLIREAVDRLLQSAQPDVFEYALERAFGLWKDHEIEDSSEYVRQLRKGWEERQERLGIDGETGH